MAIDLEKSNREEIIVFLRRKGMSGLSQKRREELLRMAKRIIKKEEDKSHPRRSHSVTRRRSHRGGAGDIPQGYNFGDAWAQAAPVALDANSAQTQMAGGKKHRKHRGGGEETSGATFMPPQFYDPNAPMPQPNTDMNSAYGTINAVSGSCRNLAPYPDSSGQQTGGKKKPSQKKSTSKKSEGKKSGEKKPKTHHKKEKSLWDQLMGMF